MTSPLTILERSFRSIALPAPRGSHGNRVPKRPYIGVYLLVRDEQIIYVGSSVWVPDRLWYHCDGRRKLASGLPTIGGKRFDRALCLPLPESCIRSYENALIRELRPESNKRIPERSDQDAAILFWLGLRPDLTTDDIAWQEVA